MSKQMQKIRYLLLRLFLPRRYEKELIQEALTEAIHPEFGWIWQEGEVGDRIIKGTCSLKSDRAQGVWEEKQWAKKK